MIVNEVHHTSPRTRIAIFFIAVFMLLAMFATYATIVISGGSSSSSNSSSSGLSEEEQVRYDELIAEYQSANNELANELSGRYYDELLAQKSRVRSYNAADVTEVTYEDIKVGDGAEVDSEDFIDYAAYYIGWLSDESVFDSSFDDFSNSTKLNLPLEGTTQLIQGWLDGIQGMRIGGIREVTIPSTLGYGSTEQTNIPANSPLKFVIMLIEKPEYPEVSDELQELYNKMYGITASIFTDNKKLA